MSWVSLEDAADADESGGVYQPRVVNITLDAFLSQYFDTRSQIVEHAHENTQHVTDRILKQLKMS